MSTESTESSVREIPLGVGEGEEWGKVVKYKPGFICKALILINGTFLKQIPNLGSSLTLLCQNLGHRFQILGGNNLFRVRWTECEYDNTP